MKIRKCIPYVFAGFVAFSLSTSVSSCKVKEGCGLEEQLAAPVDKRSGQLSTKRGSSSLFDKKKVSKSKKKKG